MNRMYFNYIRIIISLIIFFFNNNICQSGIDEPETHQNKMLNGRKVQFVIQDYLTEQMDQLRLKCFPAVSPQLTSRDEFDERSKHIGLYVDDELTAYGRLTPGPHSVLEGWTDGQAQVPMGKDIIDFSRACVNPLFRGALLYEAIILKGFQYATDHHYKYVVGSYEPDRYIGTRLKKLGFQHSGSPLDTKEPDGNKFFIQPIIFEIKPHHYDWERLIKLSLQSSPDKFWKNVIHLNIITLEREEFINSQALLYEIKEITAPSYEDPTALIMRDLNHCNKLYLGRESNGKLVTFFMVGWETILLDKKPIQTVFLGLSATREDQKDSGIVRHLYQRFVTDAQAWEEAHQQRLLLWYTTATPSVFYAANLTFSENQPHDDGSYTEDGKAYVLALRKYMGWPFFIEGHPFVVKGIAEKTRYSYAEKKRINYIVKRSNFSLFTDLNIDETNGDRMLRICRVPFKKKNRAKL